MKHDVKRINGLNLVGLNYHDDTGKVIATLSIVERCQVHGDPNDEIIFYDCHYLATGETLRNCVETNAAWFVHCLYETVGGRYELAQARLA